MTTILSNGLVIGGIYGLVALGISLIYKKSRVLNFAYGEIGMVGAFVFYSLYVDHGVPYLAAALVGVFVSAVLGAAGFLLLARRSADPLAMLIGTLALGGVLIYAATHIWGANQHFVPAPMAGVHLNLLGLRLVGPRLLVLAVGGLLAAASYAVFRWTRLGLVFRASASNPYAATLIGVDVRRLDLATWAIGGALSGVAAVLISPLVGFDVFFMTLLSIKGFVAGLVAGLGNVGGALVAGVGLGVVESGLTRATTQPGLPDAMLVVSILAVLLLRPGRLERGTA